MKTDTLSLTKIIPLYKTVLKDRLFYNRFEYSLGFYLSEVNCLRTLDHKFIDDMIQRRIAWAELSHQPWQKNLGHHGTILGRRRNKITDDTIKDLHELADVLLSSTVDYKLVVSCNQAHVYSNDQDLLAQLGSLSSLTNKQYTRAVISRPIDTIRLKNPQHQWRSYFKNSKITAEQKRTIKNFLTTQEGIRLSPALLAWLDVPFHRTSDYFFVDHNEMSWLTLLSLVHSGLIRKTQQIIPINK
jgi:hypothetical protein